MVNSEVKVGEFMDKISPSAGMLLSYSTVPADLVEIFSIR